MMLIRVICFILWFDARIVAPSLAVNLLLFSENVCNSTKTNQLEYCSLFVICTN